MVIYPLKHVELIVYRTITSLRQKHKIGTTGEYPPIMEDVMRSFSKVSYKPNDAEKLIFRQLGGREYPFPMPDQYCKS
jgi:hypothetical protein